MLHTVTRELGEIRKDDSGTIFLLMVFTSLLPHLMERRLKTKGHATPAWSIQVEQIRGIHVYGLPLLTPSDHLRDLEQQGRVHKTKYSRAQKMLVQLYMTEQLSLAKSICHSFHLGCAVGVEFWIVGNVPGACCISVPQSDRSALSMHRQLRSSLVVLLLDHQLKARF